MLSGVDSVSLAGLRANGITITTGEALAVAQSLFESGADDARPPFGPLSRENIVLRRDGSVTSTACATTPSVLEAAVLIEELLPEGPKPGALLYTLGRALHEVEAPPFDSMADFSRALRRFETGGRASIVRALYTRAEEPPSVVESAWQTVGLPFAAMFVAGVALIGGGEAMHIGRPVRASAIVTANPAIDARPIVFNPPPMIVRVPPASVGATPLRHHAVARRDTQPPPRRSGFPSRVLARIKIRFDEL